MSAYPRLMQPFTLAGKRLRNRVVHASMVTLMAENYRVSERMIRYYFDIRDGDELVPDEEGLELPGLQAAQLEAAASLLGIAKDTNDNHERLQMAIEVRTAEGPAFEVAFLFEVRRTKH